MNFHDKEVNDCVDNSMKLITEKEKEIQSPEVRELIEDEKQAINRMLRWVNIH